MTARDEPVRAALAWLERHGSRRTREEMADRYGIRTPKAFGVPVGKIQQLAKRLGPDHDLALHLWETGWYEARLLTAFIDEPDRVTGAQMDRWARDFDNWGVVDTLCFKLFDRTPHAWKKVDQWSTRRGEFVKRGAFALLASLALHDKTTGNAPFVKSLRLIERAATDDRNFVRKGVSWALRSVGRRNRELHAAASGLARRLVESPDPAAQWIGKDALKELTGPVVRKALAKQRRDA